jgi:hypothetical protein
LTRQAIAGNVAANAYTGTMMKPQYSLACSMLLVLAGFAAAAETADRKPADGRLFEMRTYHAAPGKLDALHSRFRDHAVRLLEKHGITSIGYWVPVDNQDDRLIFILAFPDRDAREQLFKAFMADPDWRAAVQASEKDGRLVARAESTFLIATDFSPMVRPMVSAQPRVFELRDYKSAEGRLPNLLARFRDHTVKLFEKHGMTNIAYWTPADKAHGADDTLIYILAHNSREAAAESFRSFRVDADWLAARKASEERAGGSLTAKDGVKSTMLAPTDYSPMR